MTFQTYLNTIPLLLVQLLLAKTACAQNTKATISSGSISGVVRDSATKVTLSEAIATVHHATNGSLLKTTQTDKEGYFSLLNLPVGTAVELQVTCVGYNIYKKVITLQANHKDYLPTIQLSGIRKIKDQKAAEVTAPKKAALAISGSIKGKLKDSTYKNVITSATVAVYNHLDSNLLQFTLPNDFGEFTVTKLPVNTPLKLLITHVGYTPYQKIFNLNAGNNTADFDWIYMQQNTDKKYTLEEVRITSFAPVRMNGDTLEFNPRAFKMDVNATAEDLMRKLPGVVIWGDGDITFNGKKINSLLVDGKPFMGGTDFTTATQNLPKDALDKVQIYRQRNDSNPLDSTLNANLKLKEDKKVGYFGKVGASSGTTNRFAVDGMLSGYSKKLQISNVGAFNNINKTASNINTLMRSNSYGGEGNGIDYQSDFKRAGINTGTIVGTRLQYDFIPHVENNKSRRLIVDYFFKRNNENINSTRFTNTILRTDSILSNHTISQSTNLSANNSFAGKYNQQHQNFNLSVSADAYINQDDHTSESNGEQTRTGFTGQLSNYRSLNVSHNNYNRVVFDARLRYQKEFSNDDDEATVKRKKHLLSTFNVGYKFDYQENTSDRHNLSSIISALTPSANKFFDRLYESNDNNTYHTFSISYPQLKRLLFGFAGLGGINLELNSVLIFNQNKVNGVVFDTDVNTQQLKQNNYLTNSRHESIQDILSGLSISRIFFKGLTNRYNQRFDFSLLPRLQYYSLYSVASNLAQNFNYQYHKFVPNASLRYNNHQYGDFELGSTLSYNSQVRYPTVQEIAPLVDSANVWYIPRGNVQLKPEYKTTVALKTTLESRKPKNPYQIDLVVDGNYTSDKISDSTFYDNLGRRINYSVNLNGYKYWHVGSYYRKAYSPNKSHTFRLNIWYDRYNHYIPQYLDDYLLISNNRNDDFDLEITYSFLDRVNINGKQGLSFYKNLQNNNSEPYKGLNNYIRFSGTLQLPKNLTWSTNINFNTNKAHNQPTVNYTIWNASLTYRFMNGNRAEAKISALDLLKQNKAVINNTNRNVQTLGFNNVLQQYFMFSLAYYPRKFGTKGSGSDKE